MAINLGSTAISNIKLGSTQVNKVYLGATEAWSSQPPANEWGELSYYSVWYTGATVISTSRCTAVIVDQSKIIPFLEGVGAPTSDSVQFRYSSSQGGWYQIGNVTVTAMTSEALSSASGIDVAETSGVSSANFRIGIETIVDTTSPTTTRTLTQTEYEVLGDSSSSTEYDFGTLQLPKTAVVSFSFGTLATSTPDWFLSSSSVQYVDFTNAASLISIGDSFMFGCAGFNQTINLPKSLISVGNRFLASCTTFNQPLTLPDTITSIGNGFLNNCFAMVSTTNIGSLPSSVIVADGSGIYDYSFATTSGVAASYTTGMKISGTYANDWKTKLPNRTSGTPYRKLIVAS